MITTVGVLVMLAALLINMAQIARRGWGNFPYPWFSAVAIVVHAVWAAKWLFSGAGTWILVGLAINLGAIAMHVWFLSRFERIIRRFGGIRQ